MNLTISPDEKQLLETLLTRYVAETRVGIRHTWHLEYKEMLKHEESLSQNLLDRIGKMTAAA